MLARRLAGLALILVFLLTFTPEDPMASRVALLAVGIAGIWLALANLPALGLAVGLLAAVYSAPGAADPLSGWLYPALALAGLGYFFVSMMLRFRTRMQRTHEERWAHRRRRRAAREDDSECRGSE